MVQATLNGVHVVDTLFVMRSSEAYGAKLHFKIVTTLALSLSFASASEFGSSMFCDRRVADVSYVKGGAGSVRH